MLKSYHLPRHIGKFSSQLHGGTRFRVGDEVTMAIILLQYYSSSISVLLSGGSITLDKYCSSSRRSIFLSSIFL